MFCQYLLVLVPYFGGATFTVVSYCSGHIGFMIAAAGCYFAGIILSFRLVAIINAPVAREETHITPNHILVVGVPIIK